MLRRSSKVSLRGDSARDSFSSYLLKRSGGHEGHTTLRKKFQERFFVLQGTNLLYFRSQDEYLAGSSIAGLEAGVYLRFVDGACTSRSPLTRRL